MSISIRWRLAVGIILAFVLTLVLIFVTVWFALQRILTDDLDDSLGSDAELVTAQVLLVGIADNQRIQEYLDANASSSEGHNPFLSVIRGPDGDEIATSPGFQEVNVALSASERADVLAGNTLKRTIDLPGDKEYRVRSEPLRVGGEVLGVVQVARVTEGVVDPVNTLLIILIAEGIAATLLAVGLAMWLSRGAVKPLQRVIDIAAEIEASDLTRRIHTARAPAEVRKLADTFDAMLERLDKAFREQQHFVMDVSHELRTPLTVLKGNLDVMLMDSGISPDTREHYDRMASEVSRMIRLTTNLLYIASTEAGREPERRLVELDVVCLEVLRQSRDLRPDVKLGMGDEDQVTVVGDRDQLKQMVLNLVENAVKFTPDGGQVRLSLSGNGSQAQVAVTDTGPGIASDVLPHIFQRFFRGTQRGMLGGTGLGLAIAERIARAHGGSISVESEVGRGSTFTVSLPVGVGAQADGSP